MSRGSTDEGSSPTQSRGRSRNSREDILGDDREVESAENSSDESQGGRFQPITQSNTAASFGKDGGREFRRRESKAVIEDSDRAELVRIATALSRRHSVATGAGGLTRVATLVIDDEHDSALDPASNNFDINKWLQSFVKTLQKEGITAKQTGVVYKNLDVYGSGAALQVQETVGSVVTAPLRLGEFFSFGKKEPRHILRKFDGFIRSGELLVVLGRPGSGCSTLLKTLCGELHGLQLGDESVIHYNTIPQKLMKKEFKGEAIYNQEVCDFGKPAHFMASNGMLFRSISISPISLWAKLLSLPLPYGHHRTASTT